MPKLGVSYKLTPQRHADIVRWLAMGCYLETAARACGIERTALWKWLRLGRAERERDRPVKIIARPVVFDRHGKRVPPETPGYVWGEPLEHGSEAYTEALMARPTRIERFTSGCYRAFAEDAETAMARHEGMLVACITKAGKTQWQAALELLARKHPQRYEQHRTTERERRLALRREAHPDPGELTPEQRKARIAELEAKRGTGP